MSSTCEKHATLSARVPGHFIYRYRGIYKSIYVYIHITKKYNEIYIYVYAGRRTILEANETSTFWPRLTLGGVARASGAGAEYHTTGSTGVGGSPKVRGWLRMAYGCAVFLGGKPSFWLVARENNKIIQDPPSRGANSHQRP